MPIANGPKYRYNLACGHAFYTSTRSTVFDARHWFPCRCGTVHALTFAELVYIEEVPRRLSGSRISENQLVVMIDNVLKRERVVRALRRTNGAYPDRVVAEECGVAERIVWELRKLLEIDPYTAPGERLRDDW